MKGLYIKLSLSKHDLISLVNIHHNLRHSRGVEVSKEKEDL